MKAALLTGIQRFEIREVPDPALINDSDVLIRVKAVGVCGSDIHYYTNGRIGSQMVQFPFILGHEAAGIVEQTGSAVTRVNPGERIAIDPARSCGECDQCRAGREHTCRKLLFLGSPKQMTGALSEFLVLHESCCYPISDTVTMDQAVLSEPLAIALYSVKRAELSEKGSIGILGAGPIGMSVLHVLRTMMTGAVYVTEKIRERLAVAFTLKPVWAGSPDQADVVGEILKLEPLQLDVVFECSGDPEAMLQGIQLLKPGGRLMIIGIPEPEEVSLPIHELRRKEISIHSIRRQVHCTQPAIDLLASCRITLDSMVTHHFSLDESQKAFDLVSNYRNGVMKAIIVC